jgi:hypothetical protein
MTAENLAGDPFESTSSPILYDGDYMYLVNADHPSFPPMAPKWITPEEARAIWPTKTVQDYETEVHNTLSQEPADYLTLTGIREIQMEVNRRLKTSMYQALQTKKAIESPKKITVAGIEIPIQVDPSVPPGRVEIRYPDGRRQFFNLDGM